MNHALLSVTTQLSRGLAGLKQSLGAFESRRISKISSVYRRIDESTEGTLSSEVVVALSVSTPLELDPFRIWLEERRSEAPGTRWLLLAFNHEFHLDPRSPIPHPDLHLDPLILRCAAEIEGGFEHPVLGRSLQELVKSSQSSFGKTQFEFLSRGESLLAPLSEDP